MKKEARLARVYEEFSELMKRIYPERELTLVFGEGDPDAKVMLIGEAPGLQETLQLKPFVGTAGKNLDAFLEMVGMKREELYISNVVKFRPTKENPQTGRLSNRPPQPAEVQLCYHVLAKEIAIISPKTVVTLGNTALKAVTDDKKSLIGNMHGKISQFKLDEKSYDIYPLYHPASIIYNRSLKETYEEDVRALAVYLRKAGQIK